MILKKLPFLCAALLAGVFAFGQNTYPWPSVGNIGIGTQSPMTPLEVRVDQSGATRVAVRNLAAGGATADYQLVTQSPFSYVISALHENSGNPYYQFSMGSGVNSANFDAPEINFRSPSAVTLMKITNTGSVGIGTTAPGSYKLAVEGKIGAREVHVTMQAWADYVFDKSYTLMKLQEVEAYIKAHKHLPNIPSAAEVQEKGIDLGVMNAKLLEKIEELTLYVIELKKENDLIKEKVEKLEAKQ